MSRVVNAEANISAAQATALEAGPNVVLGSTGHDAGRGPRLIGEVATDHLLARLSLGTMKPSRQLTSQPTTVRPGERANLPTRPVHRGSGEVLAPR